MNIVNVIFNFLLIYPTREISLFGSSFTVYGAGLEVNGAAIASSLGMAVAGLMTLWVAFFRKNEYQIHMKNGWKIDKALTKQIFGISFPLCWSEFLCHLPAYLLPAALPHWELPM